MTKVSERIKQANRKAIKVGARVTTYGGMKGEIIDVSAAKNTNPI